MACGSASALVVRLMWSSAIAILEGYGEELSLLRGCEFR